MARNVMKHIVHNWGSNILSIHDGIGPPFVIPTKKMKCAVEKGDGGVQHQHRALPLLPALHLAVVVVVVVIVEEQTKAIHVGL